MNETEQTTPKSDFLKLAAKLLPDLIGISHTVEGVKFYWLHKTDTCDCRIIDTELLTICHLIEQGMVGITLNKYMSEFGSWFVYIRSPWPERAEAIVKVYGKENADIRRVSPDSAQPKP